jgi:hypothetical protein
VRKCILTIVGLVAWQLAICGEVLAEIRTYRFVVDGSLPFSASCGECGPPVAGHRADIEGTFTVSFDREAGTSALLSLDDRLVSVFATLYSQSGLVLEPAEWPAENSGIIPAYIREYEPPLQGLLRVEEDTLRLTSDGVRPIENGSYRIVPSYDITLNGDEASFNMGVPIIDYWITVTDVAAVEVISGDFNNDGAVNAADYVVWRKGFGTVYSQIHYDAWRAGGQAAAGSSLVVAGVPEPTTLAMLLAAMLIVSVRLQHPCVSAA